MPKRKRPPSAFVTEDEVMDVGYRHGISIRPGHRPRSGNWVDDACTAALELAALVSRRRQNTLPYPAIGQEWCDQAGVVHTVIEVTSTPTTPEQAAEFPVLVIYRTPEGHKWPRSLGHWYATMRPALPPPGPAPASQPA